jgi:hypothetical protein
MTQLNFLETLEKAIENLLTKKNQKRAVKSVQDYLSANGFPPSHNKDNLIRQLNRVIEEEGPDSHQQVVDMLLWQKTKPVKLTKAQKANLALIRDLIINAPVQCACEHKHVALTGSLHGGGFSPLLPYPEIICRDCGVNVTIYTGDSKTLLNEYGIEISKKNLVTVKEWLGMGEEYMGRKKFAFGEDVVKNPQRVLTECDVWEGELPFAITDLEKFNARSGA